MDAKQRIVVALDVPDAADALDLARALHGEVGWIKVATTLFTRAGAAIVTDLRDMGFQVFLDLKFHDIPAQVRGACASAASIGASLLTVHCSGGPEMLRAAAEGAREGGGNCRVLGVTVLTSLDEDDLGILGVDRSPAEQVRSLATLAAESGVDGVVCSPKELSLLRLELPPPFLLVTPGIRPAGSARGDQKRVLSPAEAAAGGADLLVIGRPITRADDPAAAARAIAGEILTA
jgi:orotidine-5'-phosphate decarboxylase